MAVTFLTFNLLLFYWVSLTFEKMTPLRVPGRRNSQNRPAVRRAVLIVTAKQDVFIIAKCTRFVIFGAYSVLFRH